MQIASLGEGLLQYPEKSKIILPLTTSKTIWSANCVSLLLPLFLSSLPSILMFVTLIYHVSPLIRL